MGIHQFINIGKPQTCKAGKTKNILYKGQAINQKVFVISFLETGSEPGTARPREDVSDKSSRVGFFPVSEDENHSLAKPQGYRENQERPLSLIFVATGVVLRKNGFS